MNAKFSKTTTPSNLAVLLSLGVLLGCNGDDENNDISAVNSPQGISSAALQVCVPTHDSYSPAVTLGSPGAETLTKAYAALPPSGGVIKVPYGEYGCDKAMWVAGATSVYKDVTIEGIKDSGGNRPIFSCQTGTFIAFGPPMYEADNITPSTTKPVALIVKSIELKGWGRWVSGFNIHKIALHDVKADGRLDGVVRTGKGFVMDERVGKNQTAHSEICDSDIGGAGGGNIDHPSYTHGGPSIETGTFAFVRSICRESNGSHCVKTTAAAKVLIEDSTFLNECLPGQLCGTQQLNMVSAAKLNLVRRNTFIRGNNLDRDKFIPGESIVSLSNRFWYPPNSGYPEGHEFSPLYDRAYGTPEYNDPEFWAAARAGGESHTNPHLRLSVFTDNVFIHHSNRPRHAFLFAGTFPTTKEVYTSDCMTALPPPAGWMELTRAVLGNNTYIGDFPLDQDGKLDPVDVRLPNLCGAPMPAEAQPTPVWDLGGNGPEGTPKVDLPEWVRSL